MFICSDGKRWQHTYMHCDAKNLLKGSAFLRSLKSFHHWLTEEVLKVLLLKKRFNIFQSVLGAISGLLSFLLNSLIYFSLASKIILVHLFDLVSIFFFYNSYNIVLLNQRKRDWHFVKSWFWWKLLKSSLKMILSYIL